MLTAGPSPDYACTTQGHTLPKSYLLGHTKARSVIDECANCHIAHCLHATLYCYLKSRIIPSTSPGVGQHDISRLHPTEFSVGAALFVRVRLALQYTSMHKIETESNRMHARYRAARTVLTIFHSQGTMCVNMCT